MRTQEEIVARIQERRPGDMFGFEVDVYFNYLDFEHAKTYLKPDTEATATNWEMSDLDRVLVSMKEYMPFAWDKANDSRGISAVRSIKHFIAWIWLLGDDEFANVVETQLNTNYRFYGKEILISICAKYGWDYTQYDDGVRTNE